MEDVVCTLRNIYKIPINFEEAPFNIKENAITLDQAIGQLESLPSRTEMEERRLKSLRSQKESGKAASIIVGYKQKRFDISFPSELIDITSVLDVLVKKDPEYAWERSNTSIIIYPKESMNKNKVSLVLKDSDADNALKRLSDDILVPLKLNYGVFGKPAYMQDKSIRVKLNLTEVGLYTCLNRFVECLGSNVVWTIKGGITESGWRNFGLDTIEASY